MEPPIKQSLPGSSWPSTSSAATDKLLRRTRIVEARRLALESSKATQDRYRHALVADIEEELFQRKVRVCV